MTWADVAITLLLAMGALVMIFPFVWQVTVSLSTQAEVTQRPPSLIPETLMFGNFLRVFDFMPFANQLWVSVATTALRTISQLLFCSLAGYAFARMRFKGKNVIFGLFMAVLMVPGQIFLLPQYEIVTNLGLLNTILGISLPGLTSAFGTFLMRQHFMTMPRELEEAARIDGASPGQIFFRIMLPLAGPALSSLTIITALACWNDLLWPLTVATADTNMPLTVGIASFTGERYTDHPLMMAASVMATAPVLLLFLALQRQVVNGLARQGLK